MSSGFSLNRGRRTLLLWRFVLAGLVAAPLFGQTLRIYHIDVEQGDATLLVAPNGKSLLVDSGKNGHGKRIQAVMGQAGVRRIDFFVNTHYHEDHYGGIDDLVALGVPVGESFDRGDKKYLPERKKRDSTYQGYLGSVGGRARRLRRGATLPLDPTMTVTCISSGGVVAGEENPVPGVSEHDMGLALLITLGDFRYFLGGDIGRRTESKIAARDLALDVDVYRSNAHGSDTSSTPSFLEDLNPTVVIISNGNSARHQHPRGETLKRYGGLPSPPSVFQTNKFLEEGLGDNVPDASIADVQSSETDGTIVVTVTPGARDYTVSFGPDFSYSFFALRSLKQQGVAEQTVTEPVTQPEQAQPGVTEPVTEPDQAQPGGTQPVTEPSLTRPDIPPKVLVAGPPPPVKLETLATSGPRFFYVGIFLALCLAAGTVGYFWITAGPVQKGQPPRKHPSIAARPVAAVGPVLEPVPVPHPVPENEDAAPAVPSPSKFRLRWERFPDSEIPEPLQGGDRNTWVRRQPGRLTSRQGCVNVNFAEEIDFLTNVPVTIEHELCLSVAERPAAENGLPEAGAETLGVYSKGAALLTALGNCSDADKAVLLKAEIDSWLDDVDSAIGARFSSATPSLIRGVEGSNLRQRTERMLAQLLKLIQGHPRIRNTQDTQINLKTGGSLGPGAETFRDSFTDFELEQLLDVGALEEC